MKKRTKTLAWLLALVLVFALLPGEVLAAEQDSPEELLAAMTTEEKVTQLLMPALRYYTDEEGTLCGMAELTPDAAALLEEYAFAGVVVFSQNAEDTDKHLHFDANITSIPKFLTALTLLQYKKTTFNTLCKIKHTVSL